MDTSTSPFKCYTEPTLPLNAFTAMYGEPAIFKLPKEAFVVVDDVRVLSHQWLGENGYLDPHGYFQE